MSGGHAISLVATRGAIVAAIVMTQGAVALACDAAAYRAIGPTYDDESERLGERWVVGCDAITVGAHQLLALSTSGETDADKRGGYFDTDYDVELLWLASPEGKPPRLVARQHVGAPAAGGQPGAKLELLPYAVPVAVLEVERRSDGEGTEIEVSLWHLAQEGPERLGSERYEPSSGSGYPHTNERFVLHHGPSLFGPGPDLTWSVAGEYCEMPDECVERQRQERLCFGPPSTWRPAQSCWLASAAASSSLDQVKSQAYLPERAADGDATTAWVEGKGGSGKGEWLRLQLAAPAAISALSIIPGYAKSAASWAKNNRIATATVSLSDGTTTRATFRDAMEPQAVALAPKTKVTWVKIEIVEVFRGSAFDDTCISEVLPVP